MRLLDLEVASESCPAGNDDDDDDEELDDTEKILQTQSPLQGDRELIHIAQTCLMLTLSATPCTRKAVVRHASPTPRWFQRLTST